jgi:pimeloyl-ACP methyl ester carboxylesterase
MSPSPHWRRRTILAAVVATATVAMGLAATSGSSVATPGESARPAAEVQAPVPTIDWKPCRWDDSLRCARVPVPLDYDDPTGPAIKLSLLMNPANRPGRRIGSLFVNPGGPGGSATEFATYAGSLLGPAVRQRFDVIGIDPRGIGGSAPVRCHLPGQPPPYPRTAFPYTAKQIEKWLRYDRYYRKLCREGGNPILDHMSTADTARDMDLIRQALGEEQLSFYGISYGSYLGATYAAMFPDRIRAMIVDGVLDPVAWSTGRGDAAETLPIETRIRSGVGAWEALTSAFAECDRVGKERCPLAGNAASKWLRIVHRLRRGPVQVDGYRLTYPNWVGSALGPLYDASGVRYLMRYIKATYRDMFGSRSVRQRTDSYAALLQLRRVVDRFPLPGPYGPSGPVGHATASPGYHGVACADSLNPSDPRAWIAAGKLADRWGPWFSRLWTWLSSACARWPGSKADTYFGPWTVETSAPVLVIGNTHDPSTPIHGARVLNTKLEGSRLLILDGWGHGALATGPCVTSKMQRYLVDVALPPSGTVCEPARQLFPKRS